MKEGLRRTQNKLVYVGKPIPFEVVDFLKQLEGLAEASYENSDHIAEMVEEIVTTYHPEQHDDNDKGKDTDARVS